MNTKAVKQTGMGQSAEFELKIKKLREIYADANEYLESRA